MALEYTDHSGSYEWQSSSSGELSRDEIRGEFVATHKDYLKLNQEIARSGACFKTYLPAWRKDRDAWARFYSKGWSRFRLEELEDVYQIKFLRWRLALAIACNKKLPVAYYTRDTRVTSVFPRSALQKVIVQA